ncbi:hypothetical protein IW262DRAFT_1300859 [Armillaria fumosa]|nr:hypothetical protein IW262DRAFT_1300859 [Armillaria fumosa]
MYTYTTGMTLGAPAEHRKLAIAPPTLGNDIFTRRAPRLCSDDRYTGLDTVEKPPTRSLRSPIKGDRLKSVMGVLPVMNIPFHTNVLDPNCVDLVWNEIIYLCAESIPKVGEDPMVLALQLLVLVVLASSSWSLLMERGTKVRDGPV